MASHPPQGLDAHVEEQLPTTEAERQDTLVSAHPQPRLPFPSPGPWDGGFCQWLSMILALGLGLSMDRREGLVAYDGGVAVAQQQHCASCSLLASWGN